MISAGYDQIREYKKRARLRARFLYPDAWRLMGFLLYDLSFFIF